MARGNGQRGGGDRVLESRHLVGLFLGVVLLCGVFFTLGYVMGKTQYGGAVHAASAAERSAFPVRPAVNPKDAESAPAAAPAPPNGEWDFYTKNNDNRIEPAPKPAAPVKTPAPAAAPNIAAASTKTAPATAKVVPVAASRYQPPKMLKGSVVLQIAALRHESDALAMADALQQKRFPAFVVTPAADSLFRVQVGPYPDERAAESARSALDHAGFKAIVKR